ncbi:hypothetical protein ABFT23_05995 [Nocardioides sp. C4-1]|uniref:hypothetical protein n=1 Tax=Nocardioides sp. C4-1 TaxID=3151851 RepID=UPI003267B7BF
MRSPRIVVAVLALALAAMLALTPSGATAREVARGDLLQVAPAQADPAPVVVGARVVEKRVRKKGPKRLVMVGKVVPAKGPVYIQRATKCNKATSTCNFKFYKKVFLKKGGYQAVIEAAPKLRAWVWRAKVKASFSEVWMTCTKRPSQECKLPYVKPRKK